MERIYLIVYVGKEGARNVARRLRRKGYEAHTMGRWVKAYAQGEQHAALTELRNVMRAVAPRSIEVEWGVCE